MTKLRLLLVAALLAVAPARAQAPASPEEISFWETVRDSKNPAELQAYIDQYPNGRFVVLAKARLAALQKPAPARSAPAAAAAKPAPAAIASFAPSSVTSETRMPQAGDTWTYRLTYPRIRGQWGQRARPPSTHVVTVAAAADGKIVDQVSIDGGRPIEMQHSSAAYVTAQAVSVFSPYLVAYRDLAPRMSLGGVAILDAGCSGRYACDASARVVGQESVQLPGGTFKAAKVVVTHEWRPSGGGSGAAALAGMMGGCTVTLWYVPELKRVVKVQSRINVGDTPPVEADFDLELLSYQVK